MALNSLFIKNNKQVNEYSVTNKLTNPSNNIVGKVIICLVTVVFWNNFLKYEN